MAAGEATEVVFELKPMGLADLLDTVIRLFRRHFGEIVRIAAVIYVPLGVLQVASSALLFGGINMTPEQPLTSYHPGLTIAGVVGHVVWFLLFWVTMPLVQAAIAKAVAEFYLGRKADVSSAYSFALRRWPTLILVGILGAVITGGVIVVLSLPAIPLVLQARPLVEGQWDIGSIAAGATAILVVLVALHVSLALGVRLFFAALVVVLEEEGAFRSLARSWELTTGYFWRTVLALLVLWLFVGVGNMIFLLPAQVISSLLSVLSLAGAQAFNGAMQALAQILIYPLQIIGTVLLYYDLRMRKEGFDLMMMAEAIGEPEMAVRIASGEAAPTALFGPTAALDSKEKAVDTDEPKNPDNLSGI